MNFFKKHKILTTFLLLFIFFIFYEVIPEIRGDKVFLPTRLFYSHPELADEIVVKAYILTDEQVGELFLHPDKEPQSVLNDVIGTWLADGTPPPRVNLVFRIQNRNHWIAGTIQYNINDSLIGKFEVHGLSADSGKKTDFLNFVIPLGGIAISLGQPEGSYPKITYKWRELYASW